MKKIALITIIFAFAQSASALNCYGTEPFWGAEVSKSKISLDNIGAEEKNKISITKVDSAAGMTSDYMQIYSNARGPVAVVKKVDECTDGMSDNTFAQEIILFTDKEVLVGCCGEPKKK